MAQQRQSSRDRRPGNGRYALGNGGDAFLSLRQWYAFLCRWHSAQSFELLIKGIPHLRPCQSIYAAYRGVHVESLRDAYLIRIANNFGATLFFDVVNLSKKAEIEKAEDIFLLRCERGAIVPRVLYPDRGKFKDIVYFEIYGATIIGTNETLNTIAETRAAQITMPDSDRQFPDDVKPEDALDLKARLTAFPARHLNDELPAADKPAKGRLGDILRPLVQIIKLVYPEDEAEFMALVAGVHVR